MAVLMLVEDDPDMRDAMEDILTEAGHSVLMAVNGKDAVGVLERAAELPRLIILDLKMPVMTGCQFRQAQCRDARWRRIPTVIYSAQSPDCHPHLRVRGFIRKPFQLEELLSTVAEQLHKGLISPAEAEKTTDVCASCSLGTVY